MSSDDVTSPVTTVTEENSVSDSPVAEIRYNEIDDIPHDLLAIFTAILTRILHEEMEDGGQGSRVSQGIERDATGGLQPGSPTESRQEAG